MLFNNELMDTLLAQAKVSPRLRQHFDLRTSASDTSQRMLNALWPGTEVPVHRHEETAETVVCLRGKLEEVLYEAVQEGGEQTFREVSRQLLSPQEGLYGMQIPADVWHTVHVLEPSVIFEAKDGAYKP
ncbi:mannose-6-phosphate isomerase [Parabacteroides sp. An277]|uniref:WbuC family cupin fold metalloprotein n=1 Tax=Parabacteroides sp. An277 TaxID=1965619 RepID=UPI000B3A966E|nr:WbuC family cupin fold metalloprotein [Parabacteroides sp. An277]OUO52418.1 mannose-6-phosphate isomerase [Parabacteroides sp. An277]